MMHHPVARWTPGRTALVVGHPGHELRIHHWLESVRPITYVLTDGSGSTGRSRIASTTRVIERVGARRGSLYGVLSDRELYDAILRRELATFLQIAQDLATALRREGVTSVVGDAAEGVNPGHDVCRLLINTAVALIGRESAGRVTNFDFPVEGPPNACPPEDRPQAFFLELDDAAYARKIAAARAYPEFAAELERILRIYDIAAFRAECIRPVRYGFDIAGLFEHPCVYERHGEHQVSKGIYRDVIRFSHVAEIAEALAARTHPEGARPAVDLAANN